MESKFEKIIECLNDTSENDLFDIYNQYADKNHYENYYDMDEFDEIMGDADPIDIANKIYYGDFRPCDNYFMFDGCVNLLSFNYPSEEMNFEEIADYIIRNDEDFGYDEIREILDEEDGEE